MKSGSRADQARELPDSVVTRWVEIGLTVKSQNPIT